MTLIKPTSILLAFVIVSSCSRKSETTPVIEGENRMIPISKIQSDPNFIQLIKDQIDFYANVQNPTKIKEVLADGQITKEEYQHYPSYFGYQSASKFEDYFLVLNQRSSYLNATYNFKDLSRDEKKAVLAEGFRRALTHKLNPELSVTDGTCESIRVNCIIAVSAETAIMHLGCVAADFTVILGIICHSAATAYQISAGNNCNTNYQQCKNAAIQ